MVIPIVTCTVDGKCLPVLQASVKAYAPDVDLISHKVERSTFGECYNAAMAQAFQNYDEIIIANDDIVLTPSSYKILLEDVEALKQIYGNKLGFVGACSDCTRNDQNIKFCDNTIVRALPAVSPLFSWISKRAFDLVQFPPINWFSDDVICWDLNKLGFINYASRSYVHHAGSQTIGPDTYRLYLDAIEWMEKERQDLIPFFKR